MVTWGGHFNWPKTFQQKNQNIEIKTRRKGAHLTLNLLHPNKKTKPTKLANNTVKQGHLTRLQLNQIHNKITTKNKTKTQQHTNTTQPTIQNKTCNTTPKPKEPLWNLEHQHFMQHALVFLQLLCFAENIITLCFEQNTVFVYHWYWHPFLHPFQQPPFWKGVHFLGEILNCNLFIARKRFFARKFIR